MMTVLENKAVSIGRGFEDLEETMDVLGDRRTTRSIRPDRNRVVQVPSSLDRILHLAVRSERSRSNKGSACPRPFEGVATADG